MKFKKFIYNSDSRALERAAPVWEAQVFQDLARREPSASGGGIRLASRNLQTSFSVYWFLAFELFSKSAAVIPVRPMHRVQASSRSSVNRPAVAVSHSLLTFPT